MKVDALYALTRALTTQILWFSAKVVMLGCTRGALENGYHPTSPKSSAVILAFSRVKPNPMRKSA